MTHTLEPTEVLLVNQKDISVMHKSQRSRRPAVGGRPSGNYGRILHCVYKQAYKSL
jgi:hypothetical protein